MKELEQILELWARAESVGESAVLATVVKTRGSSYRLPGARLLLTSRGQRVGSVSGGCLEEDLVKKAWWLTESGPMIRRYDTTPDGEIASGYGLGCNGIIHVLLERLKPGVARVLELIRDVRSERRTALIAHLIEPPDAAGQRLIVDTRGVVTHNLASAELASRLASELPSRDREGAAFHGADHSANSRNLIPGVFIETLTPPVRLLVFGAGDDAVPLTRLAKFLGWTISVFDGRAHYARPEKFPHADEVVLRQTGSSAPPKIDPWTVAVLMSHSYTQDLDVLRQLSSQPLSYLGVLGPAKRTVQLLAEAGLEPGRLIPGLHSPMGLDIGADGPEQVALAVIAEIQATLNGRQGGLLREREGSIHAREDHASDPENLWVQSIACA